MKALTVFYDPACGLCCQFRRWFEEQALWVPVEFVGYDTPEAARRFPGLKEVGADRECVVQADDGGWWQGADAWLVCLWATKAYRFWSHRLAAPHFRPWVEKIVHGISRNRLRLSVLVRLTSEREVGEALEPLHCEDGVCQLGRKSLAERSCA